MKGIKRQGDWKEVIPSITSSNSKSSSHEYSGLIGNITSEIGVEHVIDFGCGEGHLCNTFSKGAYLGLDIDEKVIDIAKKSFEGYIFKKPDGAIYSTDMCIASKVFSELNEESIHNILRCMRCKWLLVVESLKHKESAHNIFPFYTRDRESYIKLMRIHDLLLVKHRIKSFTKEQVEDVSFLLFKKVGRNPNF